MTSGPPRVAPGISVAEAVQVMKEHSSGSVLVGLSGTAEGIVSEADVVRRVVALGEDPAKTTVSQIMTSPLISVDIKVPVYDVYRTMADHHIRHLLITDGGEEVGFVSVKDLIAKPVF